MDDTACGQAQELIGKTSVRYHSVTHRDIKRFAQAIGDPNPLYYDEEFAKTTRHRGIIAPPLFCQTFIFEDVPVNQLPDDLSPAETNIALTGLKTVGGSSEFELHHPVRVNDQIRVTTKVHDIFSKQGKSALLYFVQVETSFHNQDELLVARELATYIKREDSR